MRVSSTPLRTVHVAALTAIFNSGWFLADEVSGQVANPAPNRGGMKARADEALRAGTGYELPVRSDRVRLQPKGVLNVAISGDGTRIAAGGEAALMIWDGSDAHALTVIDRGHEVVINKLAFSVDGRWLASGGPARSVEVVGAFGSTYRYEGGIINLWEVSSGRRLASINPRNAADDLKFVPNGDLMATAGGTHYLSSWLAGGDRPARFEEIRKVDLLGRYYSQLPCATSFSERGERVAGRVTLGGVLLRAADDPAVRKLPYGDRPSATVVALSGSGDKLAVMGFNQSITIWDFKTMALERELPPPTRPESIGRPTLLTFSPDGKSLLSGGEDGIVRIWDLSDGRLSRTIIGPSLPVRAVAFLDRGLRLVSGGWSVLPPQNQGVSDLVIWDVGPQPQP